MTNPGDINKPNLIDQCAGALIGMGTDEMDRITPQEAALTVIEVLRRRGLINSLGLEILDRDSGETK